MVFDEGDVETGFAPELDVGAGEEVEGCLLETALWRLGMVLADEEEVVVALGLELTFGYGEEKTTF